MKKGLIIFLAIIAIVLIGGCNMYKSTQNRLNAGEKEVKAKWAEVQNQYQRRADLIGNLVATVKGAAKFEKETYTETALARAGQLKQATQTSADQLTPAKMAEIEKASKEAVQATRMMINVAVEAYPNLKATQNFADLQVQLEGTENRISVARGNFNTSVQAYNTAVTNFPTNIFAGWMGFKERPEFQADAAAQSAPKVEF